MQGNILLVIGSKKNKTGLLHLLSDSGFSHVTAVSDGEEARIQIAQQEFGLVIINAPLPNELGHELALSIAASTLASVIIMVKAEIAASVSAKVCSKGIIVLSKPLQKSIFQQAVQMALCSNQKAVQLQQENKKLQNTIAELKLIDRAKCVLIQYLKLTEQQAHHYIEKQAMDLRCKKIQVAETILTMYE